MSNDKGARDGRGAGNGGDKYRSAPIWDSIEKKKKEKEGK